MAKIIFILSIVPLIIIVFALLNCFVFVQQQSVAIIQRFGKFSRILQPGLGFKLPIIEQVAGRPSLRVQQLDVRVDTKTKDNVFTHMVVSVQFYIIKDKVYEAFYLLNMPETQITSYVFDVVRAKVPKLILDDVFEKKDDIAQSVKSELDEIMEQFGFGILKALVTDIDPDANVKKAMNEINAAQRLRHAAEEKGEADKIIKVKSAEAEAQSKALQGKGIADQRREIVNGLRESVDDFRGGVPDASAQDVMNLILMTQYFDTLKDLGQTSNTTTVLVPHSPGSIGDIAAQIRDSVYVGNKLKDS